MKNAIAGPREVVGHVVHGRHQSTVSENSASHIQTSKQPVEDKMEPMNFMGESCNYGWVTRPEILFNIIYIMRTLIVMAQ